MYKITIKPRAYNDIDYLTDYLSEQNSSTTSALSLLDNIESTIENISLFPKIGVLTNIKYLSSENIRKVIIDKYILYYELLEDKEEINIVRVISGLMKIEHIL